MKLALGSGSRFYGSDWTHIDGGMHPHTIGHRDVEHLPFDDNSVDLLYASHLIAYFDRQEFARILKEWYRVIKPGGIIRLATPDFTVMNRLIEAEKIGLDDILGPLYGRMEMIGGGLIYHKTVWNYNSLREALSVVGFKYIFRYLWRDTEHSHVDDHSMAHLCPKGDKENGVLISLNIQATK